MGDTAVRSSGHWNAHFTLIWETFCVLISVSGEKRWPCRSREYVSQLPGSLSALTMRSKGTCAKVAGHERRKSGRRNIHSLCSRRFMVYLSGTKAVDISSPAFSSFVRSEEHTSELQSRRDLVCRLLLEKKKKKK